MNSPITINQTKTALAIIAFAHHKTTTASSASTKIRCVILTFDLLLFLLAGLHLAHVAAQVVWHLAGLVWLLVRKDFRWFCAKFGELIVPVLVRAACFVNL